MSNVVPFVPRSAGGDWTAGERERLSELAGKLEAGGAKVEAAYGVSDAGDPWCVITDQGGEVLIHVARIGGQFLIHDAAADAVQEDESLWSAFERLMGPGWREGGDDDMVVSLRQAQSVLGWIGINLVLTFTLSGISWQGHLGGLLGGVVLGAAMVHAPHSHRSLVQWSVTGAVAVLALAVVVVRAAVIHG